MTLLIVRPTWYGSWTGMDRKECYRLTHPLSKISGYATAAAICFIWILPSRSLLASTVDNNDCCRYGSTWKARLRGTSWHWKVRTKGTRSLRLTIELSRTWANSSGQGSTVLSCRPTTPTPSSATTPVSIQLSAVADGPVRRASCIVNSRCTHWLGRWRARVQIAAVTSCPLCFCSPSSKTGSSPLKGCGG